MDSSPNVQQVNLPPSGDMHTDNLMRSAPWLVVGTLLVCLLVNYFFTPRFGLWRGLDIPEAWFNPEVSRAVDSLKQLDNPQVRIDNRSNQVINWRLLFPYIGHYLHFPNWLYLSLPHVGCLLAVGYLFRLLWNCTGSWSWAFMGAGSLATSDWFFVSMGWLAYFDSWFVLGILMVAFSTSRLAVALACLLTPWVDERFVLALVGCVVVRWLYQRDWEGRGRRDLVLDCLLILTLVLPYVAVRVFFTLTQDAGSASYLKEYALAIGQLSWFRLLEGLWAGFRVAWLFVVAFLVMVWLRGPRPASIAATATVAGLLGIALVVAGDISRSMAMLLPFCVMGLLWLASRHPRRARMALPFVLVANLLLPAEHVISTFKLPIFYIHHEVAQWRNPPPYLNPIDHINEGMRLLDAGRAVQASHYYDNAIRLDPRLPEAYLVRGLARLGNQDLEGARQDFDQALLLRPLWADALYFRGLSSAKAGSPGAAIIDLRTALQAAPAAWPHRQQCQDALSQLETQ